MLTSELVRDKFSLGYMDDELMVLDKLAGKEIALHLFNEDANKWITGSNGQTSTYFLTRYLLPIADYDHLTVGIHLLPSYVAQERFVVAQFDPESERLVDYAHSMRAYVHRVLLEFEADDIDIGQDLQVARKVFGDDFYREQHNQSSFDHLERTMIAAYGGATADYRDLARSAALRKSPDEQIDWLKQGAEAVPECMYFHWELAQLYSQQGDSTAAAQSFVRSLECYHHTACRLRPEDYYALGCELLEKAPSAFPDTARCDLTLADGEARMRWLVSLFQKGKVETSVRLLSNFRYDSGTDLHPILFEFLRLHYEELGWKWALAWCDLCAVEEDYETRRYRYRGQPLSANWDQPVRQVLGLS